MNLYFVTAMKRGVKALNASLFQFLRSVKRFIAVTFYEKSSFNASSPLLFKVTLPTSAGAIYFQTSANLVTQPF
jgi:hypothetical protein